MLYYAISVHKGIPFIWRNCLLRYIRWIPKISKLLSVPKTPRSSCDCTIKALVLYNYYYYIIILFSLSTKTLIHVYGLSKIKSGTNTGPISTKAGWAWHATIYIFCSGSRVLSMGPWLALNENAPVCLPIAIWYIFPQQIPYMVITEVLKVGCLDCQVFTDLRGRSLMIWGAEEKSKMNLFFPQECVLKMIFFPGEGLLAFIEICFFPGGGPPFFFCSISSGPTHRWLMGVPLYHSGG